MKKILKASILASVIIAGTFSKNISSAAEDNNNVIKDDDTEQIFDISYSDVSKNSWYYPSVSYLSEKNVIGGYPNGQFNPDDFITREELAQLAYKITRLPEYEKDFKKEPKKDFDDIEENRWSYEAIKFLKDYDIVKGRTETEFVPDELVTREEAAVIIERLMGYIYEVRDTGSYGTLEFVDSSEVSDWADYSLGYLESNVIISGYEDGTIRPHNNITRAEVSEMLAKAFK